MNPNRPPSSAPNAADGSTVAHLPTSLASPATPALDRGLYVKWLRRSRPSVTFHESSEGPVPERWLQQIWRHQRLRRDALHLADGRTVQVLHPGFWNRQAGPDFRGAVVQFEGGSPISGDVEIDRTESGWRSHRHAGNPAYSRVILHVVWRAAPLPRDPPLLALEPHLDTALTELSGWLEEEAPGLLPASVPGRCSRPLATIPIDISVELLEQAAALRLHRKTTEFGIRARHVGWEGALWEGLMTGLGYRHNVWPMRRLAELLGPGRPMESSLGNDNLVLGWEARLLGVAGMLSEPGRTPPDSAHVRTLWDAWWHERAVWAGHTLPGSVWKLAGVRPANHPQRRLALAARWMARGTIVDDLTDWLQAEVAPSAGANELRTVLEPEEMEDSFWKWHWTLRSGRCAQPQPLLGDGRVTDLAVNIVLPWLLARALAGENQSLVAEIQRRYFSWPAAEENAVLRKIRQRLMGQSGRQLPHRAALQQGLMRISGDFCEPSGALCSGCTFPDLVAATQQPPTHGAPGSGRM